jgi:hypothetical protein
MRVWSHRIAVHVIDSPRQLTRQGDPSVLIKALRYGHDYTARIDFSTLGRATGGPGRRDPRKS